MKKTLIVNINGIIFHIDEDAYNRLNAYLDALHRYFDLQPEGREIVSDIESRIAELFQPRIKEGKQSIILEDVEEVIGILGKPEDIAGSGEESTTAEKRPPVYEKQYSKRLYRDPENAVLGGVCSGLAAYFSIDPLIMRLVFVALFFAGGASILIYLILWIVLPKAVTVAQRLEMRGEEININNIGRTYHHSAEPVRAEKENLAERSFMALGRMFRFAGKVIAVIFGAFLILLGVFIIISVISAAFIQNFVFHGTIFSESTSLYEYIGPIIYPQDPALLLTLALIIIGIPLVGLIYAGLKIIIRFKAKDKFAILSFIAVWIIAVIVGVVMVFTVVGKFPNGNSSKEIFALNSPKSGMIYLKTPDPFHGEEDIIKLNDLVYSRMYGIGIKNGHKELYGGNRIRIEKGYNSYPELEIVRKARGKTYSDALSAATKIKVSYLQTDSLLNIDPVFRVPQTDFWNLEVCEITLRLPVGMKLFIDDSVEPFLYDVQNVNNYWDHNMAGKAWQMTEGGLELMRFSVTEKNKIKLPAGKKLFIQVNDRFSVPEDMLDRHEFGYIEQDGQGKNYRSIRFQIKKSEDSNAFLQIEKNSAWDSDFDDNMLSRSISYNYSVQDSILWLDPIFLFPKNVKKKDQEVNLSLFLPMNAEVELSHKMTHLLENDFLQDHLDQQLEMTLDGLKEIGEKKVSNE